MEDTFSWKGYEGFVQCNSVSQSRQVGKVNTKEEDGDSNLAKLRR